VFVGRQNAFAFIVALLLVAALLPVIDAPSARAQAPAVVINEFMAANNNGVVDNTGQFEDWIELHNTSGATTDLSGWTIADGGDTYTFGATTIPGGGYVVVFASGDPARSTANEIHLPFKLTADGEPLSLRDPVGTLSAPDFPAPGYPALPTDVSYGLDSNGALAFFTAPTPGAPNTGGAGGLVSPVTFSVEHGFYNSSQTVTLGTATPGATIRYTLDGTTPTADVGTALAAGQTITVSSTSTVRAVAYRTGWIASTVETRSYLFTADIMTQSESVPTGWPASGAANSQAMDYGMDPNVVNGNQAAVAAALTSIPSLSIVTDQANLTDETDGIYVNAQQKGREWERAASVELIDPTGAEPGFEINAGLRIRGGGSRRVGNPKHSFRLYFRDDYGDGALEYPLFGDAGVDRFESLGLATGQNGSWAYRNPEAATWVRDPWIRATQGAMGQPNTDSRHYHIYLNGIYWGLYYSQERLSGDHGVEHFGGLDDDYDVVGGNWRSAATASDGTVDDLRALYPLVSDLFVNNSEFATLAQEVNLESLADYYLLHFYSGDFDAAPTGWNPAGVRWEDSNNWRAMRNRAGVGAAGKWLFFDHDSEFTFCGPSSPLDVNNTTPWNLNSGSVPNHQIPTPAWLHEALITHPTYRQIFRDSVAEHMLAPGGALTSAENQARFDTIIGQMSGSIEGESARWGDSLGEPARTRSDWENNIAVMRQCADDRLAVVEQQLRDDDLWPGQEAPQISPASGAVEFGTDVTITTNEPNSTLWFTIDGSDPRDVTGELSLSAVQYTGPISVTEAMTVTVRSRTGLDWSPLTQATYSLSTPAGPVRLLLNEYNAVSGSKFLGGGAAGDTANGTDATFGRVAGNGGDWFELVVLDNLDITGWTFEVWHLDTGLLERSAALQVTNAPELAELQPGTIITVSEDIPDDLTWNPSAGDWHINLQANSLDQGGFFTAASQQNFAIDKDDTQIAIFDANGAPVALRTGEGTVDGVSVNSEEVFKLEAAPTSEITSGDIAYADGTSSTWGLPNVWGNGASTQNFDELRFTMGDVDCDDALTLGDALAVAQYSVGIRAGVASCPVDLLTQVHLPSSDVDNDGFADLGDALLIAQCTVGIPNVLCDE
jgi:hypothetical protein